jgi:hypothetical protein
MADNFKFDIFLSHSAKDKAVVRPLAERLRKDGLRKDSQPSTTWRPAEPGAPLHSPAAQRRCSLATKIPRNPPLRDADDEILADFRAHADTTTHQEFQAVWRGRR